jgi:hypothetical protein
MKVVGMKRRAVFNGQARSVPRRTGTIGVGDGLDEKPRSVYEVVTRQMLMGLKEDVAEVKGRVNTLLWVVLGATVVEFVMRLVR